MNTKTSPDGNRSPGDNVAWGRFRERMPVTAKWIYLDHAAVAPLPGPTAEAIAAFGQSAAAEGDAVWPQWQARYEQVRKTAAGLFGAMPHELAFVPSTTFGIGLVAEGFPWKAGDNVVTFENEFPSNLYPWMNLASRGVETRRVPVVDGRPDLNRLASACDERTRIVTVSWIGYSSGWRLDPKELADLAHSAGALLFLDAIQGLGVFPMDVKEAGVDFFAADGHKWMMGPEGAGVFYCREEHLDTLRPVMIGWNSVQGRYDFGGVELKFRREAARYEGGSPGHLGVHALGASLDLLAEFGLSASHSAVADRVVEITGLFASKLVAGGAEIVSPRHSGHESGILVFKLPGQSPEEIRSRCLDAGIVLSCRGGGVRVSPHAYISEDDVDRLVEVVCSQ